MYNLFLLIKLTYSDFFSKLHLGIEENMFSINLMCLYEKQFFQLHNNNFITKVLYTTDITFGFVKNKSEKS